MKIKRRDYSQGSGNQEQKLNEDELLIDRLVYRKLSSLTDNKVLVTPDAPDTEFHRWLLEMDNLHVYKYYPLLHSGAIPTPDIIALDEYLATLGLAEEYPFQQDTYAVESWVDIEDKNEIRIITDETDNTYLTYDGDVLVRQL